MSSYWHGDFEEDECDEIPGKFIIGIYYGVPGDIFSDEVAVIVHRASDRYPIDGDEANAKRDKARRIVDALNLAEEVES